MLIYFFVHCHRCIKSFWDRCNLSTKVIPDYYSLPSIIAFSGYSVPVFLESSCVNHIVDDACATDCFPSRPETTPVFHTFSKNLSHQLLLLFYDF